MPQNLPCSKDQHQFDELSVIYGTIHHLISVYGLQGIDCKGISDGLTFLFGSANYDGKRQDFTIVQRMINTKSMAKRRGMAIKRSKLLNTRI